MKNKAKTQRERMAVIERLQLWSQLPGDILTTIAKCLNATAAANAGMVDTLRLRSVCKSWRYSIPPFKPTPPLPLNLLFPISPNPNLNPNRRGHFSLSQSIIYFLQTPPFPPSSTSSSSSSHNNNHNLPWLLRVEEAENGGGTKKWHPLIPLSKTLTEKVPKSFPKSLNLLDFRISEIGTAYSLQFVDRSEEAIETEFDELRSIVVKKVAVSSTPWSGSGDDYAVMAIHGGKLGFFKLGDEKWSLIDSESRYDDVVYHKGKFYAVDYRGRLIVIGSDLKAERAAFSFPYRGGGQFKHLVISGDDLYLVDKYWDAEDPFLFDESEQCFVYNASVDTDIPVHLKVYKLNEKHKDWYRVGDLDGQVFFVGDDCSFTVSVQDFPALKGNCIYFSEDEFADSNEQEKRLREFCGDTAVYNLEDRSCGPLVLFPDHWPIFWPPPTWIKPKPHALKKK